jgi:hypothetical protein
MLSGYSNDYNESMSTPPTTFETVFGFLQLLSDLPGSLHKSAQEFMTEVQKNLAVMSEQMAKGMAEYERMEAEAFELLKRGGWLGMERHLTGPQVRASPYAMAALQGRPPRCPFSRAASDLRGVTALPPTRPACCLFFIMDGWSLRPETQASAVCKCARWRSPSWFGSNVSGRAKCRQSAACLILVFCSIFTQASTFTATLKNGTGTTLTTAYLHFELWNCGTNFPTISGQPQTIVQFTFDLKANPTTGVITGTVLGNDLILCGNVANTEWIVTPMFGQNQPFGNGSSTMAISLDPKWTRERSHSLGPATRTTRKHLFVGGENGIL